MEDLIKENFGAIWPIHVANMSRFLIECRHHFRGDLDLLLLMSIIGDRTLSKRRMPASSTFETFNSDELSEVEPEPINIRSIAEYSGIPRETVRRKIRILEQKGWVSFQANEAIVATIKARDDLAPLTETTIRYLSTMVLMMK